MLNSSNNKDNDSDCSIEDVFINDSEKETYLDLLANEVINNSTIIELRFFDSLEKKQLKIGLNFSNCSNNNVQNNLIRNFI